MYGWRAPSSYAVCEHLAATYNYRELRKEDYLPGAMSGAAWGYVRAVPSGNTIHVAPFSCRTLSVRPRAIRLTVCELHFCAFWFSSPRLPPAPAPKSSPSRRKPQRGTTPRTSRRFIRLVTPFLSTGPSSTCFISTGASVRR